MAAFRFTQFRFSHHTVLCAANMLVSIVASASEICILMIKVLAVVSLLKSLGYSLVLSPEWVVFANEIPITQPEVAIFLMLIPSNWGSMLLRKFEDEEEDEGDLEGESERNRRLDCLADKYYDAKAGGASVANDVASEYKNLQH